MPPKTTIGRQTSCGRCPNSLSLLICCNRIDALPDWPALMSRGEQSSVLIVNLDSSSQLIMESKVKQSDHAIKSHRKFSDQSIQVDDSTVDRKQFQAFESLYGRKAQIAGFSVKQEGSFSTYKLYEIFSEKQGQRMEVQRRYRDFEWLHDILVTSFYGLVLPRLPEKNIKTTLGFEDMTYQAERMRLLERYLNILLRKQLVCKSPVLLAFMSLSIADFAIYQSESKTNEVPDFLKVTQFDEVRQSLWSLVSAP